MAFSTGRKGFATGGVKKRRQVGALQITANADGGALADARAADTD